MWPCHKSVLTWVKRCGAPPTLYRFSTPMIPIQNFATLLDGGDTSNKIPHSLKVRHLDRCLQLPWAAHSPNLPTPHSPTTRLHKNGHAKSRCNHAIDSLVLLLYVSALFLRLHSISIAHSLAWGSSQFVRCTKRVSGCCETLISLLTTSGLWPRSHRIRWHSTLNSFFQVGDLSALSLSSPVCLLAGDSPSTHPDRCSLCICSEVD